MRHVRTDEMKNVNQPKTFCLKGRFLGLAIIVLLAFVMTSCSKGLARETESAEYQDEASPSQAVEETESTLDQSVDTESGSPYLERLEAYKKEDWKAQWIWTEKSPKNAYVAFRKQFELNEMPEEAIANIAGESKYNLWVNGELVVLDGGVKRGPTPDDGYYEKVDLKSYLNIGENTIAVLSVYNGRSSNSQIDPGHGGFLFELDLGEICIQSDESFKAMRLKAYKNQSLLRSDWPNYPQSSMLGEWNVYYDARDNVGDYRLADFDDSDWEAASVVYNVGEAPFNDTYQSITPKIRFSQDYIYLDSPYLDKTLTEDTTIVVNLPENMQFSPYFKLSADQEGLRITYYTDTLTSQGIDSFKDDYVTIKGQQDYESYPWRSGSQLIIQAPAGVCFQQIGVRVSTFDSLVEGAFLSDNPQLNTLWKKSANTLKMCMRDTYMDCPERERSPYIGDAANQISESFYALDSNANLLTKQTLLTLMGWAHPDGVLPLRSPSAVDNECPAQTLAFLVATNEYYMNTGDFDTIERFYPAAIAYLKLWDIQDNGLITYRDGSFQWVDWGEQIDNEVIQNAWYYYALKSVYQLSQALGDNEDRDFFESRIASIEDGFDQYWTSNGYTSGQVVDDRANALAVVSGLANETKYPVIAELLSQQKMASPFMEKYVLEALCIMKDNDLAIDRMLERYQDMIEDEGSTLWELWHKDEGTINHGWSGGPLTIMSQYLAGIKPTKPGYQAYEISLSQELKTLNVKVPTVKGNITYDLQKISRGGWLLTLKTIGTHGILRIPKEMGSNIEIEGDSYHLLEGTSEQYEVEIEGNQYTINLN